MEMACDPQANTKENRIAFMRAISLVLHVAP